MHVLENEDGGALLRDRLEEAPPGRERLLLGSGARLDPDQRQKTGSEPRTVVALGEYGLELAAASAGESDS